MPDTFEMREPCRQCRETHGTVENKGGQDVVRCRAGHYCYCRPKRRDVTKKTGSSIRRNDRDDFEELAGEIENLALTIGEHSAALRAVGRSDSADHSLDVYRKVIDILDEIRRRLA